MKTFAFPAYRRRTREGAGRSSNRNFWKVKGIISKHLYWHTYIISSTGWLQGWVRKVGDRKVWMSDGRWLGQWHHQTFTIGFFENGCSMAALAKPFRYDGIFSLSHWRMWKCVLSSGNAAVSHAVSVGVWNETEIPNVFKVKMQKCESGVTHLDRNIWKCCSFTGSQTKSSSLSLDSCTLGNKGNAPCLRLMLQALFVPYGQYMYICDPGWEEKGCDWTGQLGREGKATYYHKRRMTAGQILYFSSWFISRFVY